MLRIISRPGDRGALPISVLAVFVLDAHCPLDHDTRGGLPSSRKALVGSLA